MQNHNKTEEQFKKHHSTVLKNKITTPNRHTEKAVKLEIKYRQHSTIKKHNTAKKILYRICFRNDELITLLYCICRLLQLCCLDNVGRSLTPAGLVFDQLTS